MRRQSTVFANMDACTNNAGCREGCGCGSVKNPWYATYQWGLIPLLAGLLGAATLIGSVTRRLVFLNGAVVIGLVAQSSIHAFFNERYSSVDLYSICCFSRSLLPPFAILLQHGSPHFDSASDG